MLSKRRRFSLSTSNFQSIYVQFLRQQWKYQRKSKLSLCSILSQFSYLWAVFFPVSTTRLQSNVEPSRLDDAFSPPFRSTSLTSLMQSFCFFMRFAFLRWDLGYGRTRATIFQSEIMFNQSVSNKLLDKSSCFVFSYFCFEL